MEYRNSYISPLGRILLTADEIGLTGLAFEGQKNAVRTEKCCSRFDPGK